MQVLGLLMVFHGYSVFDSLFQIREAFELKNVTKSGKSPQKVTLKLT